ncbi:hypothetical protein [Acidocella sp.]|jgi:hypothetical protein|uniref:hypothetical protein n=1 Tax=Acidocella sp. TaxID=50710 RepID=UPI00262D37C8|nr:hypothetical protein [Acidocella sp.]
MRANLMVLAAFLVSTGALAGASLAAQAVGMDVEMLAAGVCAALAGAVLMRAVVALGEGRDKAAKWPRGQSRV